MADNEDDFVASIGEMISYFMDLRGLPKNDGNALAQAVTEQIRNRYQGERVTIRKKPHNIRAQVRAAYNGRNANELADHFGISRSCVYRYCKNLSKTRRN
jgi:DNA invertase Pin-like site-specific DNA recombinase